VKLDIICVLLKKGVNPDIARRQSQCFQPLDLTLEYFGSDMLRSQSKDEETQCQFLFHNADKFIKTNIYLRSNVTKPMILICRNHSVRKRVLIV